jgi:hypothetical protein
MNVLAVSKLQRSGPFAGASDVQTEKRAADQQEKQTRPTANSDLRPGAQFAFDLSLDTIPPPRPDGPIPAAQYFVFVSSAKARSSFRIPPRTVK